MVQSTDVIRFLEDIQSAYMKRAYGKVIDYEKEFNFDKFFDFLCDTYHFKISDRDKVLGELNMMKTAHLISRYENPYYYRFFNDILTAMHDIKDKFLDCSEVEYPVFGTVELEQFSAQIRSMDGGNRPIILFSSGIIQFAHIISNLLTKAFPICEATDTHIKFDLDPKKVLDIIQNNRWIEKRFTDLVMCMFLTNNTEQCDTDQPQNDNLYRTFSNSLADSFLTFIVAHESAHHYLGHMKIEHTKKMVTVQNIVYEQIELNWQQEYEADHIGALLAIPVLLQKKVDITQAVSGIYVAMWSMSIMESLHNGKNSGTTTHPPAVERRNAIKTKMEQAIGCELEILRVYDILLSTLWERFQKIAEKIESIILQGESHK